MLMNIIEKFIEFEFMLFWANSHRNNFSVILIYFGKLI